MISIFNEAGNCIISEDYSYDENGVFLGGHLIEHTAEMLAIREEYYDAENNLKQKNTYSYGDNGIMTENKQVNGNGEIIYHTVCDENGNETYRESNSFHENGKMSVKDKTEIKDGKVYYIGRSVDATPKEAYRHIPEDKLLSDYDRVPRPTAEKAIREKWNSGTHQKAAKARG